MLSLIAGKAKKRKKKSFVKFGSQPRPSEKKNKGKEKDQT